MKKMFGKLVEKLRTPTGELMENFSTPSKGFARKTYNVATAVPLMAPRVGAAASRKLVNSSLKSQYGRLGVAARGTAMGTVLAGSVVAGASAELFSPTGPAAQISETTTGSRTFAGTALGSSMRAGLGPSYNVRQGNVGYYNGRTTRTNLNSTPGAVVFGMHNRRGSGVL